MQALSTYFVDDTLLKPVAKPMTVVGSADGEGERERKRRTWFSVELPAVQPRRERH